MCWLILSLLGTWKDLDVIKYEESRYSLNSSLHFNFAYQNICTNGTLFNSLQCKQIQRSYWGLIDERRMDALLEEAHCSELQLLEVVQSSILQLVLRNWKSASKTLFYAVFCFHWFQENVNGKVGLWYAVICAIHFAISNFLWETSKLRFLFLIL